MCWCRPQVRTPFCGTQQCAQAAYRAGAQRERDLIVAWLRKVNVLTGNVTADYIASGEHALFLCTCAHEAAEHNTRRGCNVQDCPCVGFPTDAQLEERRKVQTFAASVDRVGLTTTAHLSAAMKKKP